MMTSEEGIKWLVGVRCSTYNQSRYIIDAMNGFVMQQTDFPFVCCIVDDASTDGEQEVIYDYLKEFFNLQDALVAFEKDEEYGHVTFARHKTNENCYFAVTFLKENHYSQKKTKLPYLKEWLDNVKYIALCEGDDYWTDPLKLQKQVGFLEGHPDCVMCTHAANWEIDGKMQAMGCHYENECDLTTYEVIKYGGRFLATASLVFRKELVNDRPKWRKHADVGDYPLQILGTLRGKFHYFPHVMCVYRFMHDGSWTMMMMENRVKHAIIEIGWLGELDEETNKKYHKAIQTHLFSKFIRLLYRENKISTRQYVVTYFESEKTISIYHFIKDIFRHIVMNIRGI